MEEEVENSPHDHTFPDSDDSQELEHLVRLELCQGEGFRIADSDIDVPH